jgi:hypothetical protein
MWLVMSRSAVLWFLLSLFDFCVVRTGSLVVTRGKLVARVSRPRPTAEDRGPRTGDTAWHRRAPQQTHRCTRSMNKTTGSPRTITDSALKMSSAQLSSSRRPLSHCRAWRRAASGVAPASTCSWVAAPPAISSRRPPQPCTPLRPLRRPRPPKSPCPPTRLPGNNNPTSHRHEPALASARRAPSTPRAPFVWRRPLACVGSTTFWAPASRCAAATATPRSPRPWT